MATEDKANYLTTAETNSAFVKKPVGIATGQYPEWDGAGWVPGTPGGSVRSPFARIAKATTTGKFRLFMGGDSKSTFDTSANRVFAEHLKSIYGDAGTVYQAGGDLGGSWEAAYAGWSKQPYGGMSFIRAKGTSSSTALRLLFSGDSIDVLFSRESDSTAVTVSVDGVSIGTSPAAGAQAYTQMVSVTGLTPGAHYLTVAVPGSGAVYFEGYISSWSANTGVEVINATYGGSAAGQIGSLRTPTGAQVAGIAIGAGVGIAGWAAIPADLRWYSWLVNDAGSNPDVQAFFEPVYQGLVDAARLAEEQVIVNVGMAGHYALPGDANHAEYNSMAAFIRSLGDENHVTVADFNEATILADLEEYAARYFDSAGTVDPVAGTYTGGDFIHENATATGINLQILTGAAGIPMPTSNSATQLRYDRYRSTAGVFAKAITQTIVGTYVKNYPTPNGLALDVVGEYGGRRVPFIVDGDVSNALRTRNAEILASGTSDAYGPYITGSGQVWAVDTISNTYTRITMRASGTVTLRAESGLRVTVDGTTMPYTDVGASRTQLNLSLGAGEPVTITFTVSGSGNLILTAGRFYEVAQTYTTRPTLVPTKDAGLVARLVSNTQASGASPSVDSVGAALLRAGVFIVSVAAYVNSNQSNVARGTWLVYWHGSTMMVSTIIGSAQYAGTASGLTLSNPTSGGVVAATLTHSGGSVPVKFDYSITHILIQSTP